MKIWSLTNVAADSTHSMSTLPESPIISLPPKTPHWPSFKPAKEPRVTHRNKHKRQTLLAVQFVIFDQNRSSTIPEFNIFMTSR